MPAKQWEVEKRMEKMEKEREREGKTNGERKRNLEKVDSLLINVSVRGGKRTAMLSFFVRLNTSKKSPKKPAND